MRLYENSLEHCSAIKRSKRHAFIAGVNKSVKLSDSSEFQQNSKPFKEVDLNVYVESRATELKIFFRDSRLRAFNIAHSNSSLLK